LIESIEEGAERSFNSPHLKKAFRHVRLLNPEVNEAVTIAINHIAVEVYLCSKVMF